MSSASKLIGFSRKGDIILTFESIDPIISLASSPMPNTWF